MLIHCVLFCAFQAVSAYHLSNTAIGGPFTGTLAQGSRALAINFTPRTDPSQVINLQTGTQYPIAVLPISGKIRGALLRLECVDTTNFHCRATVWSSGQRVHGVTGAVHSAPHLSKV